jgi:hypothetical protein
MGICKGHETNYVTCDMHDKIIVAHFLFEAKRYVVLDVAKR